jgi:hypothetical protein
MMRRWALSLEKTAWDSGKATILRHFALVYGVHHVTLAYDPRLQSQGG